MHRFTRRNFLRTLALSGATAWTASRLGLLTNRSLATSPLIRSQDGALEFALTAEPGRLPLAERSATLYGYNGAVPEPRLELRPGDQVRIRFSNRLPEPTNLHFHGLHVSPGGKADDAFLEIPPGENQTYDFSLPPTHPGGTFSYHPHVHHLIAGAVRNHLGESKRARDMRRPLACNPGIIGWCGMGILLAKMPWNTRSSTAGLLRRGSRPPSQTTA